MGGRRRFNRQYVLATRARNKFLHVIARSIVACADTRQISACHCEERSDVAIRVPAAGHSKEQYFRRKRNSLRIRPKYCQVARFPCKENGLPHQCAHWFAMTTGERGCEFAQSIAKLPGFSAGTRIAAPVCALVRNDRFGRYVRTRARVQCTTFLPGDADCRTSALQPQGRCRLQHVIARSEATWQSVLLAVAQNKKQYLGRIRKSAYEFARSSTKLPGFSAGTRIATGVRTGSQ